MNFLKITVILIFLINSNLFSQTKYLIFFKSKNPEAVRQLNKSSNLKAVAEKYLSQKSVARRIKTLGKENFFSYDDLPVPQKFINELQAKGIKIINKLKWFNAVSAYLTNEQYDVIKNLPFVKSVRKVNKFLIRRNELKTNGIPEVTSIGRIDDYYNYGQSYQQYELSGIPEVHNLGINGKGVVIGILDNGFRWKVHPATLNANVIAEYDFVFHDSVTANEPEDISSQDSHGTRVFSIIGGFDEGNIIGPAFGASFILAKTEDNRSETHVEEDNYAAALEWMDSIGVDITTSSLGYSTFDDSVFSYTYEDMDGKTTIVTKAAEKAFDKGILTVTSAGNEGYKPWHFITAPADGINTLAIGAVDENNVVTGFSSRGPTFDGRIKPDLVAQGRLVYSASVAGNTYSFASGTSMSAPIAAGVAGQLLSAFPELNNRQLRHILLETADNSDNPDNNRGYGLVSAAKALSFPNIVKINNVYTLRKAFVDTVKIKSGTVKLIYHVGDSDMLVPVDMTQNNFYFESTVFDMLNDKVEFWFEYGDSSGFSYRDPQEGNYYWQKGLENVYKNLELPALSRLPTDFVLEQNYPNPFNSTTTITYSIPSVEPQDFAPVQLKVYDILGREVATLVNKQQQPGNFEVTFYASNLSSGVYYYQLRAGDFIQTKKMILLK